MIFLAVIFAAVSHLIHPYRYGVGPAGAGFDNGFSSGFDI